MKVTENYECAGSIGMHRLYDGERLNFSHGPCSRETEGAGKGHWDSRNFLHSNKNLGHGHSQTYKKLKLKRIKPSTKLFDDIQLDEWMVE